MSNIIRFFCRYFYIYILNIDFPFPDINEKYWSLEIEILFLENIVKYLWTLITDFSEKRE